jgi:ribose-phosphate pyrophosphokinase
VNPNTDEFANNEITVQFSESVRGKDVFVINTFNSNPNKDLIETGLIIDAALHSPARRITAVLPIIYGSRQDRKDKPNKPVTIQWVAKILEASGVNGIITTSLHSPHSETAFRIHIDNVSPSTMFLRQLTKEYEKSKFTIVSTDTGGLPRARHYAKQLGADLAFADKRRTGKNKAEIINFVGNVKEKDCWIIEDMIDTGGSLCETAERLIEEGAKRVRCHATHLILSEDAVCKIDDSPIAEVWGTDSIFHDWLSDKFKIFSLNALLGDVILRTHEDRNIASQILTTR